MTVLPIVYRYRRIIKIMDNSTEILNEVSGLVEAS